MAYQAQYYGIVPLFGLTLPFDAHQAQIQNDNGPEAGYKKLFEKIEQLNSRIIDLAQADDIPVINFHDLFLTGDRKVRTEYYLEDGVHPNELGHQRMAALADSILKSSGILDPEPEEIFT
jgi:hypothetical protein